MRSIPLNNLYQARLFIDVYISGVDGSKYSFDCILDTGCVNTLVDDKILEVADHIDLGFTQPIKIAGMSTVSKAVVLKQVVFGGFVINKMLVFVAPLTGTPVLNRMLLGLNTLNNWNYEVRRTDNVINFSESQAIPIGANATSKYLNYFDKNGNYILFED